MSFPSIILEAGFNAAAGSTNLIFDSATLGLFDTGTFGDSTVGWVDLSDRGRSFTTRCGRSRALDRYQPGTSTVVFSNADDALDPNNLSGPYVNQIEPMVPVRIRAIDPTTETIYPVSRGFADSWTNQYPGFGKDSTATVQSTDGFKVLGAYEPPGPETLTGEGEDSGTRLGRILDAASWSPSDRDIDTGIATLQGTPLSDNALTEAQGVEQSELGYLYMSPDGKVTFRNRHSRITDTRSSVIQAAFTDARLGGSLGFVDPVFAYDDLLLKNSISGQILGGMAQTATDSASMAKYLPHSYNATGLWLDSDDAALDWAQWVAIQFANNELRVESIKVLPQANDALWPVVLGLRIGDLVTVAIQTPAGATVTKEVFVEGISHNVTANPKRWETTFMFSSASVLQSGEWLIFDDATFGLFDTGAFAA